MATATQQIILEVEVDDSGAVKAVKNVGKEVDKLQDKTEKVGKGGGIEFLEKIFGVVLLLASIKMILGK